MLPRAPVVPSCSICLQLWKSERRCRDAVRCRGSWVGTGSVQTDAGSPSLSHAETAVQRLHMESPIHTHRAMLVANLEANLLIM